MSPCFSFNFSLISRTAWRSRLRSIWSEFGWRKCSLFSRSSVLSWQVFPVEFRRCVFADAMFLSRSRFHLCDVMLLRKQVTSKKSNRGRMKIFWSQFSLINNLFEYAIPLLIIQRFLVEESPSGRISSWHGSKVERKWLVGVFLQSCSNLFRSFFPFVIDVQHRFEFSYPARLIFLCSFRW